MDICPPTMLQGFREVWQMRDAYRRCPAEAGHVSSCSGPAVVIARGRGPPSSCPRSWGRRGGDWRAALTVQVKAGLPAAGTGRWTQDTTLATGVLGILLAEFGGARAWRWRTRDFSQTRVLLPAPCQALRLLPCRGPVPLPEHRLQSRTSLHMTSTGSVRAGPSRPPRSTSGLLGRLRRAWAPLERTPEGPPHLASLQHSLAPAQLSPAPCSAQPTPHSIPRARSSLRGASTF